MFLKIHCVLILFNTPYTLGISYTLDGNFNLSPKLRFQYRVAPDTKYPRARLFTLLDDREIHNKHIGRHSNSPKIIDKILSTTNDSKLQIHDARVFDNLKPNKKHLKKHTETVTTEKEYYYPVKPTKAILTDEYVETSSRRPHRGNKHAGRTKANEDGDSVVHNTDNDAEKSVSIWSEEHEAFKPQKTKRRKRKGNGTEADRIKGTKDHNKGKAAKEEIKELYVKTRKVKDDPKIKEFTKHVYEQSIKVFESIKRKMGDYAMKKEVDYLMTSYDQKFGDFVRETQDQKIKTRLGGKKVILNIVDTSNRILERLVNHLITKMDDTEALRNGPAENVILNEVNKKIELENKHICSKMEICRSKDSFSTFISDLLSTILNSDDEKVIQFRDALTEVMKNTDVSRIFDADTEKKYNKSIALLEAYDIDTVRPLLFILKNLVSLKNSPIKVMGPIDSRVNKTMAYLEVLDTWETKIPPDEGNVLVWNDIRTSLRDWSSGKRSDIEDLVQAFVDHVMKAVNKFEGDEAMNIAKHFGTMLGP